MFTTQSPSTPFRQTSHYTPARPSPLGLRSPNIATPPWTMVPFSSFSLHNDSQDQTQQQSQPIFGAPASVSTPLNFSPNQANMMSPTSPSPSTRATKFSDRYATRVANPMKSTTSLARSKTRKMFMNRVRSERDEGRFEARGEQMMHADYLADKRKWEESMARDMDVLPMQGDMEEDHMLPDDDTRAFDDFVSQEEAMEMAMQQSGDQQNGSFSDDEYDDIFMTLPEPALSYESQDMDMS
ncbi:hypothetical protein N7486_008542 [Penicillium sp. IBT 16267x]|nr:hypothetical protein N7486_008542 [Penicillium sp. IBT 16267x]